jgi:hypothetical protein
MREHADDLSCPRPAGPPKEVASCQKIRLPPVSIEQVTGSILVLRGHKVLLDTDLAELYGVTTKRFNEQVRRNNERFPADFMFQLTTEELASLRSQTAASKAPPQGRGGWRYLPYAFHRARRDHGRHHIE